MGNEPKRKTIIVTSPISEGAEQMELLIQDREREGYKIVGAISVETTSNKDSKSGFMFTTKSFMVTMQLKPTYIRIFGGEMDGLVVSHEVSMRLCGAGMINVPSSGRAFVSAAGRKATINTWQEQLQYAETTVDLEKG